MILSLLIVLSLVALDQLTKWWVLSSFALLESRVVIDGFLYLTRRFNTGAAWSLFEGQIGFFILITIVALGLFVVLWKDALTKRAPWQWIGLSGRIGGTFGNFNDRLRFGGVEDFIDVLIFTYDFPVFNVADSALTLGLMAFMIGVWLDERHPRPSE
jgi:signal peptidase II